MKKIIIAAISTNNVIGCNQKIPWDNKEEINFFKETTINSAVLMGSKTFISIGAPLINRINIVISKTKKENAGNIFYFTSIAEALHYAYKLDFEKLFIIGGSEIYFQTLSEVDELLISRIPIIVDGDKYFPSIDNNNWELTEIINNKTFNVEKYVRRIAKV